MLASLMIQYACITTQGTYNVACSKAAEATLVQTGVSKTMGALEAYGQDRAKYLAVKYVGDSNIKTLGSFYYVYHVYQTRSLHLKLPTLGLANSVDTTLTPDSAQLGLQWSLR